MEPIAWKGGERLNGSEEEGGKEGGTEEEGGKEGGTEDGKKDREGLLASFSGRRGPNHERR